MNNIPASGRPTDAPAHTSPAPLRSFGQIRGFDGLRGVAVLIEFVVHLEVILPIPLFLVVTGATVSLDSFFVLSSFAITALLLKDHWPAPAMWESARSTDAEFCVCFSRYASWWWPMLSSPTPRNSGCTQRCHRSSPWSPTTRTAMPHPPLVHSSRGLPAASNISGRCPLRNSSTLSGHGSPSPS
jgi:hypothetical protein